MGGLRPKRCELCSFWDGRVLVDGSRLFDTAVCWSDGKVTGYGNCCDGFYPRSRAVRSLDGYNLGGCK
jgi:hypothetical protein